MQTRLSPFLAADTKRHGSYRCLTVNSIGPHAIASFLDRCLLEMDMARAIPGSDPILKHVAKLVLSAKPPKRCRETSKASPSTKYCPTPDREAFNHNILSLQIQPARHPQMRPQHRVQPLTNPPGHAQEPHEQYRCKTAGNNKTYCSNPPTACNRNYTRRRTETK